MARPWRLRHKLVLGLALVVGSVAVLLGGALFGLSSFVETATATQRKMEEMQIVFQLRLQVQQIGRPDEEVRRDTSRGKRDVEKAEIDRPACVARDVLEAYKLTLRNDPVRLALDPDGGEEEFARIARMEKAFDRLTEAVTVATAAQVGNEGSNRLIEDHGVKTALTELTTLTDELFSIVMGDIKYSFERSAANHRRSLYIVGSATTVAVVLVLTLLYYFSVWIFSPIKALQAGVHRVHGGDFDHPIRLGSQDELEELANEFNAMTMRLRDVYADLARQVNERTRQLVRSERMVSVGFLAAGVAHEINNPLASIAFCAEALERRLQTVLARAPGEAEVILKYLRMMQEEAQRCKQITQKLLDFSRSGGRREPADLTHLVQDVIEVAQCLPNARGKRIDFHADGNVIAPVSVPDVKGVVLNLVVNALDSMTDGGLLTVALAAHDEFAEVTFTDTGCGMTPDVLENIFEPFFTRSRTGAGTGLGLSISHQVIDQHGGTIAVTSSGPSRGSTFTVRLPLRSDSDSDSAGEKPGSEEARVLAFPGARVSAA